MKKTDRIEAAPTPGRDGATGKTSTTCAHQQALLKLSPSELEDELIKSAEVAECDQTAQFLKRNGGNVKPPKLYSAYKTAPKC